jgi:hypothetical protein
MSLERTIAREDGSGPLQGLQKATEPTEETRLRTGPISIMIAIAAAAGALALSSAPALAEEPPRAYSNGGELTETPLPIVAWGEIQLHSTVLGKIHCLNSFYAQGWNQHEHFEATKPIRGYGEVLGWGNSVCEAPEEIASLEVAHKREIEEGKIQAPITVTATAEMPLERIGRQAEICIEATKTLEQCAAKNAEGKYTEREVRVVTSEFHRRVVTLPWKVELIRGEREEEAGVLQRIGVAEFGEAGTAAAHTSKCYPKEHELPATFKVLPAGCIGVNILFPQIPAEFVFYGSQEIWALNGVKNGLSPSHLHFLEAGTLTSPENLEGEGSTTGEIKLIGANGVELMTAK